MPVFRVQVNYTFLTVNKWSNVWHVNASSMVAVSSNLVNVMEGYLLQLLSSACVLKSFLVSEDGTDAFNTIDRNEPGLYSSSGPLLPLFNSVKAIFPSPDFGRPDLKYFKGLVGENVQSDGVLASTPMGDWDNTLTEMINDMDTGATPLCSTDGTLYSAASIQPAVQMRQMHRKRRKAPVTP
jgi:hypothetical protein